MENKMITIKNVCNHMIGIDVPELRMSRSIAPGKLIKMEKDLLEQALTYPGVPELFNRRYLHLVEQEITEEISNGYLEPQLSESDGMTEEEFVKIIETGTDLQFDKILREADPTKYDTIVSAALKAQNITLSKANLIKKVTGKDIFEMKRFMEA